MSTVETKVGRFVWHDHISADAEAGRRFYEGLLGWEFEAFDAGGFEYPMIKVGDTTHGGFGPSDEAPPHWLGHVYVEDADAAAERAIAAGGSIVTPAMDIPDVGRMVVVADPQGAVVSLYTSVSPDFQPAEGVFVWDELTTTDPESAKQFYSEVVGWESRDMDMGNGYTYTLFSSGGADRAGCGPKMPGDESPPAWMPYIGTDDVDATFEKAKGLASITTYLEPMDIPGVGRLTIFADPTGAAIGLYRPE